MTVTDITILRLTHVLAKESPTLPLSLVKKLSKVKAVQETASGLSCYHFQQVEDPSIVYIIGSWDSIAAHDDFLLSPQNQKLMELLRDDVIRAGEKGNGITTWHIDNNVFIDPFPARSVFTAPTVSFGRLLVSKGKKDAFIQKFSEIKGICYEFSKPYQFLGAGWRIEKESEEKEEWAQFGGWESVDHHMSFGETKGFEQFWEIVSIAEAFEVKHMKAINSLYVDLC